MKVSILLLPALFFSVSIRAGESNSLQLGLFDGSQPAQLKQISLEGSELNTPLPSTLKTPLGSVWKLFVYFYLVDNSLPAPDYLCQGRDPEEKFCGPKGTVVDKKSALAHSCSPFFNPRRLGIKPLDWTNYWRKNVPENFEWLSQLEKLQPERSVKVEELLKALSDLKRRKVAFLQTRSALGGVVVEGTAHSALRLFGNTLRVKTYTWNDPLLPEKYTGGFAGWLNDGTAVWASASGASGKVIGDWGPRLVSVLGRSPNNPSRECVQVDFLDRYPVVRVTNVDGKPAPSGALYGSFTADLKNGRSLRFDSKGEIQLSDGRLIGSFSVNEYVARVLQREVSVVPEEAAKAFAIAIRTYLIQNASLKNGCYVISDSSNRQRVSLSPPSAETLQLADWTDALVLKGVPSLRYHSVSPGVNRLAWSSAQKLAHEGYFFDEILHAAYPSGQLVVSELRREEDCVPLDRTERWLLAQSTTWATRLRDTTGFEPPATMKVCALRSGFPYVDYEHDRIFARGIEQPEDQIALAHEYLHLAFKNHPRGRDQEFIERLARELTSHETKESL